jgi:hypothetical protein
MRSRGRIVTWLLLVFIIATPPALMAQAPCNGLIAGAWCAWVTVNYEECIICIEGWCNDRCPTLGDFALCLGIGTGVCVGAHYYDPQPEPEDPGFGGGSSGGGGASGGW